MIATWMIAATLLGAATGVAALALERALRLLGRQARAVWLAALLATAAWPVLAPVLLRPSRAAAAVQVLASGPTAHAPDAAPQTGGRSYAILVRDSLARLDVPLALLWGAVTLLLLVRATRALRALHRLAGRAERRIIDGQRVLVSAAVGPAAFGIIEPQIVLPRWALDLDATTRAMVLHHEQEHVAARDPAVLAVATVGAALMPWNPALWYIARRLRLATEVDCDERVLRRGADAPRYARLLLLMSQRPAPAAFAAPMAGSPTTLHHRITAMHATRPARPLLRVAALVTVALGAATVMVSPVLAGEFASVGRQLPRPAQDPTTRPARVVQTTRLREPNKVRELPLVVVSPDRSVEVPFQRPSRGAPTDTIRRPAVPRDSASLTGDSSGTRAQATPLKLVVDSIAPRSPREPRKVAADSAARRQGYFDFKVDSQVVFAPGGAPSPSYPDILRAAGVGGDLIVQLVVDTSGLPLPATLKVVRSPHELFEVSVRSVLPQLRFRPATVGARRVRQLIQLIYRFETDGATPSPLPAIPSDLRSFVITVTAKPR